MIQVADKKNKETYKRKLTVINWEVSMENIFISFVKLSSDNNAYEAILLNLHLVCVELDFINLLPSLFHSLQNVNYFLKLLFEIVINKLHFFVAPNYTSFNFMSLAFNNLRIFN